MAIDIFEIKQELVIFLRNQITDTHNPSRVSSEIEYFSGNNSTTSFELNKDISRNGFHMLKNVSSVKVNGLTKTNFTDYSADYQGDNPGTITFTTAPDNASTDNTQVKEMTVRQVYHLMVTWGVLMSIDVPDTEEDAEAFADGVTQLADKLYKASKAHPKKRKQ